jgi:hypothetical protein
MQMDEYQFSANVQKSEYSAEFNQSGRTIQ